MPSSYRGSRTSWSCFRLSKRCSFQTHGSAAGLIRNAVWDRLHAFDPSGSEGNDVDVVYFNAEVAAQHHDMAIEAELREQMPDVLWEVRNQARMHGRNEDPPYRSTEDAMRYWPDTATAIAARLSNGRVEVLAPFGVEDLVEFTVRPTPAFATKHDQYRKRLAAKNWSARWPRLVFTQQ